tara:strand:+ start:28 stop:555 length:528 start_codon:yes stop_codon:yes gene_type:complete
MKTYKMEAGSYYIGDPCYVLGSSGYWDSLMDTCKYFETHRDGVYTVNDFDGQQHRVAFFSTGGDGGMEASDNFTYGVDSGTLSCIPASFVLPPRNLGPLGRTFEHHAKVHTLPSKEECETHWLKEWKARPKNGETFYDPTKEKKILPPLMFKVGVDKETGNVHFGELAIHCHWLL